MLFKKDNPCNPKNYRPISLLSCVGKFMESIMAKKIYLWAENNNIINKIQSGFRKNHNTNDHIYRLLQCIKQGFNRHRTTTAVFLDVEKAFDRVWHDGLIHKLSLLGINKEILDWLKSFLHKRCCAVTIDDQLSESFTPIYGVPQGSPLSPILFILYVSDIPNSGSNSIHVTQFADDIAIWCTAGSANVTEKMIQTYNTQKK